MPPKPPDGNPLAAALLNQKDAARYLGVSVNTFKRRVRHQLPCIDLGGATRYSRASLDRWIADTEQHV